MRILVADDSPYAADSLAELLRLELGCSVVVAYEGAQALQMALAERPDVSILDIRMPRLDGIEVARQLRSAAATQGEGGAPRLIAVTGDLGVNDKWTEIDGSFDAAYAKPIDIERLIGDLTRHWHGRPARPTRVRFDLQECFTRAVRDVLPLMAAKGQVVCFDCSDEPVVVEADEIGLRSALYRLMAGLADVIEQGFVVLNAEVQTDASGAAVLTMTAGGTGELAPAARIEHVLQRLSLVHENRSVPGLTGTFMSATGICPSSAGEVAFTAQAGEGALFRLQWTGGPAEPRTERAASAGGARAWVIDTDGPAAEMLERRLQRFGWRVRRFDRVADAAAALDATPPGTPPALLVVHEASTSRREHAALAQRLPMQVTELLLVNAGSPTLTGAEGDAAPLTVRVQPLSPGDIARLTEHVLRVDDDSTRNGPVSAWSMLSQPRSRVLVVDDNDVNRMVASGLVKALGYDVVCASDGLDAIEQCKASPPDVVLMDVNMPVLGGIDATRRLRELQRAGRVAPFPIVAATAAVDEDTEQRCRDAGMDGFLSKPLRLPLMRSELRRVTHQEA
ncbi:MAG: response regulator [Pseudomonadota bacterium]